MTEITEFKPAAAPTGRLAANRSLAKSLIDRLGALVGLLLILPLLLAVALLIKLDSPGPVLFTQRRHGRDGTIFTIFKFRTMTASESREPFVQATVNDARVTRFGQILRKTSIDELPQLINVLRGEMSLIGPRPHPLALDKKFRDLVPNYMQRYAVRPGLTGLAQISGHRGETPTVASMAGRVGCDLDYIANWTIWLDLKILLLTPLTSAEAIYGKR
jgi:putative colanic acid biosynthesis UDP-glucose lipid carrier transferase